MNYCYETHCHTCEGSGCASATGEQLADFYKEKGYDGIIVTDHFFNGNCAVNSSLPWAEKVELYCKGYENAKARGEQIGLTVMFGIEYSYNGTDLLTYGIDKAWLLAHPEVMEIGIKEYMELIHQSGGIIVHAHPFREASYIDTIRLYPHDVDAVEVFNAGNYDDEFNHRAKWYAQSYGLTMVSGSDRHHIDGKRNGGTVFSHKIESIEDYIRLVKAGEITQLKAEKFFSA